MSRLIRVNQLIKQEVAKIIQDKLIGEVGFVSILDVDTNADLSNAKVYYSVFGDENEKEKTDKKLKQASKFIKGELGRAIHLKRTPNLRFIYDPSIERGANLLATMKSLENDQ